MKVRVDLERDDPKFAFPAARLVGLYRCLWESYVSKLQAHRWPEAKAEQSDLEGGWYAPEKKEGGLQVRHHNQLFRLRFSNRHWNYPRRGWLVYLMTGITLPDSVMQVSLITQEKGERLSSRGDMPGFVGIETLYLSLRIK